MDTHATGKDASANEDTNRSTKDSDGSPDAPTPGSIPVGYVTVFEMTSATGMANTSLTCPDSSDGCDDCSDANERYFVGRDSETGFSWSDLVLTGRTRSQSDIYDNTDDCVASISDECHDISVVGDAPLVGGGKGHGVRAAMVADCNNSGDYSRFDHRIYSATPHQDDPWEDLSDIYFEMDMVIEDVAAWDKSTWNRVIEISQVADFKTSVLLVRGASGVCSDAPCFFMKRDSNRSGQRDNVIQPESNKPFRLRFWYRGSATNGLWKGTYTCDDCSVPVPETTIKEWTDVDTQGSASHPVALKFPSVGGSGFTVPRVFYITRMAIAKSQ